MKRFEQFPHTADIGMHVYGKDLKELFENAAFSMFDVIADLEGMKSPVTQHFEINASNKEDLLVAWLDELLYNFYTRGIIFSKFEIGEISDKYIKAKAFGREVGANRNRLKTEIKSVTYSGMSINKTDEGFQVDIIFDV
ncbi:MAG: archease [Candidatus Omnitrophota bacterium]